jgi:hypothetical protein
VKKHNISNLKFSQNLLTPARKSAILNLLDRGAADLTAGNARRPGLSKLAQTGQVKPASREKGQRATKSSAARTSL